MKSHPLLSDFHLFSRAFNSTKHQMWLSLKLLFLVSIVMSVLMTIAEKTAYPDYDFLDALVWTFVMYVQDPAEILDVPHTLLGQIFGTIIGFVGIAIFAVPAGLIGSGFIDAMTQEKREKELADNRILLTKAFRRTSDRIFRDYLSSLPGGCPKGLEKCNHVPQCIPVTKLQVRQEMDISDIIATVKAFPEFRLKNQAQAFTDTETPQDRLLLESFPLNTEYGCFINRKSDITILSTSSFDELGTGWFAYYLAKLSGFNYISKDLEVDKNELDSFYNMAPEPKYNMMTRDSYSSDYPKRRKETSILDKKDMVRKIYLKDLFSVSGSGKWVVCILTKLKRGENNLDIVYEYHKRDGSGSTVTDMEVLKRIVSEISEDQITIENTSRFPLQPNFIGYRIKEQNGLEQTNIIVFRINSEIINFAPSKLKFAYRLGEILNRCISPGNRIRPEDIDDFSRPGFGYIENI